MAQTKASRRAEFGDFQTPPALARQLCGVLAEKGVRPRSVVEPTCGRGSLLLAAVEAFPEARKAIGLEINEAYLASARDSLGRIEHRASVEFINGDFFKTDWAALLHGLPEPILLIGNPPWVTNSRLSVLGSENVPVKTNFKKHNGIEAVTGKSNFDISEWMLIRLLELLHGRRATLAMLCKKAVARKVLAHAWQTDLGISEAAVHGIDAGLHFDAAVEACVLCVTLDPGGRCSEAAEYTHLAYERPTRAIGWREGMLVADVSAYGKWRHLLTEKGPAWRSGIKHDCSAVMELKVDAGGYRNGLGELVGLEETYLYPMLKSSDLANGRPDKRLRRMLVTQRTIGAETSPLAQVAPKTWAYLQSHASLLARRGSSIYRNRPPFSVFGVGTYTFAPWKVAISGLYKRLEFTVVAPVDGKPVVFDDTCYFLPCWSEDEACLAHRLLSSPVCREFYESFVFWDAKRPITVDLLRRLDLYKLMHELGFRGAGGSMLLHPPERNGVDSNNLTLFG